MYYHGFDTETTGLIDFKVDLMDASQPRLVQLASCVMADDGTIVDSFCHIVKPDGFVIDDGSIATKTHGITHTRAMAEGKPIEFVLSAFDVHKSMCGARVAHNLSYDKRIMAREYGIAGRERGDSDALLSYCTMIGSTSYCGLTKNNRPKWPTLTELHQHLFGEGFSGAHDAGNDLAATMRCFAELRKRGVL